MKNSIIWKKKIHILQRRIEKLIRALLNTPKDSKWEMSAKDISTFVTKVEQDDSQGRKEHLTLTKQTSSKRPTNSPQNSVPEPKRAANTKEQQPCQE